MSGAPRIALVGCGPRGMGYLHYLKRIGFPFELVAAADPYVTQRDYVNTTYGNGNAKCFSDGIELIEKCDLDGVIIATPNHAHRGPAVAAMRKGIKMLLEKPVAHSMEDLKAIWDAYQQTRTPLIVGFVLRYTPFYQKLFELVHDGTIGKVLSISAEELMSDRLSALFARGEWRPSLELSGGLMLEKCSHDIDLLNWFAGGKVAKVSSFGHKTFLLPLPEAASHCGKCKISNSCRFDRTRIMNSFKKESSDELFDLWATRASDDSCIYSNKSGYPDHQIVNLEYDNGVLCNFTVAQAQPANARTMHILGSEGRIYADFLMDKITLFRHTGPNDQKVEVFDIKHDGSGHGGSDSVITTDFINLLNGCDRPDRPGLQEGVESSLICLAVDAAMYRGSLVSIKEFRDKIFSHYNGDNDCGGKSGLSSSRPQSRSQTVKTV